MKRILFFLSAVLLTGAAAFEVEVRIFPLRPTVGEPVHVTIGTPDKLDYNVRLPALSGAHWLRDALSEGQQVFNDRASYTRTFTLVPEKAGTLEIPGFEVSAGGKTGRVPPRRITVAAPSARRSNASGEEGGIPLSEAVTGRLKTASGRDEFFIGEEIPLDLDLFVLASVAEQVRVEAYPQLTGLDRAVFSDYSAVNPEQRRFDRVRRFQVERDGKSYVVYRFRTGFRALRAGTLTVKAADRVGVVQSGRGSGDPFGSGFFEDFFRSGRTVRHTVNFHPALQLKIVAPPAPPQGVLTTGLIGAWKVDARLGSVSCRVGEPAELTVAFSGGSGGETVSPPDISIPGFRVYPPEVKKSQSAVTLKYALVPLEPGEKKFQLKFAVFNPVRKQYEVTTADFAAAVARGNVKTAPAVVAAAPAPETEKDESEPPPEAPREEIFYQKPAAGCAVKVPLVRNVLLPVLLLLFGGPAVALAIVLRRRRKEEFRSNPALEKKRRRKAALPGLLRQLKRADASADFVRKEVLPFLASGYRLPAGATAGEVAGKVADPELRRFLEGLEADSFRPGAANAGPVPPEARKRLARLLKKVTLLFLLLFGATLGAAGSNGFNAKFDAGKFRDAAAAYERALSDTELCPNILYNLGGCAWREGNLPLARYRFLQAHLLAPRDTETVENLNLVNRRLLCPEVDLTSTPEELLAYCRDRLRPDGYLLLGAAAFALIFLVVPFRRRLGAAIFWTVEGIAAAVLLLSVTAAGFQMAGPYRPSRAVVVARQINLRTLPSLTVGKTEVVIPGGGDAEILEERDGYARILVNGRDGWVKADQVRPLLPAGLF